jgi:protein-disulfide isomerase
MTPSPTPSLFAMLARGLFSRNGLLLAVPAVLFLGTVIATSRQPSVNSAAASPPAPAAVVAATASATSAPSASAAATPVATPAFSADQRRQIEAIIKDYLLNNPEVMLEIQQSLEAKMEKVQAERMAAALKDNSAQVFRNPAAPVAGNPKGDVTIVEFFDYNCGYCKKALVDLVAAAEKDKNIKLVLKEFPILSKGSEETAKVALAAKVQGKYWEFHRAMLEQPGAANEAAALRVAEKIGLNVAKIRVDMASAEVKKQIDDVRALAQRLGIQGTPHFLVGDRPIGGAPEGLTEMLLTTVADIRKSGGCKIC